MLQLYVSNFGFNVQDEDLHDFFAPFGEVISAEVITDRFTGTSKGCGYVVMKKIKDAKKAIAALKNFEVDRNKILVKEAKNIHSDN
ncbi:MAG: RNA-binding protein [Chitinophagaceae bacterium]